LGLLHIGVEVIPLKGIGNLFKGCVGHVPWGCGSDSWLQVQKIYLKGVGHFAKRCGILVFKGVTFY